jgi:hypothetical protein
MADVNQQQNNPAAGRGGGAAVRGRGARGAIPANGVANMLLNPERAPALISKWQKLLGKDLERIEVVYKADGVSVDLYGLPGTKFQKVDKDDGEVALSIAEYRKIKAQETAPSAEDAKFAFRNKFEVRLNQPFPDALVAQLGDGGETALRNVVQALPFEQRRVMLMSNKQFKTAYPNGFAGAAGAAA